MIVIKRGEEGIMAYMTDLGGHSGCKILLCETEDNDIFVRKISSGLDYNKRLQEQARKQLEFHSDVIKVPDIYRQGTGNDGLFYFDMEYIQGITLAEYMNTIEIGKVRGMVETIVKNIISSKTESADVDESIFLDKIESLKDKLMDKHNNVVNEALDVLDTHSWKRFLKTQCHGDLTLENIIIKDNQLYLIDFLDSFYDCWIMDISTLMQDVQALWSYRYQNKININTIIRLIVFRDILMDTVKKLSYDNYLEVYYALLLKLIRIYPYAQDEETYKFLDKKTVSVLAIIREEEKKCVH